MNGGAAFACKTAITVDPATGLTDHVVVTVWLEDCWPIVDFWSRATPPACGTVAAGATAWAAATPAVTATATAGAGAAAVAEAGDEDAPTAATAGGAAAEAAATPAETLVPVVVSTTVTVSPTQYCEGEIVAEGVCELVLVAAR